MNIHRRRRPSELDVCTEKSQNWRGRPTFWDVCAGNVLLPSRRGKKFSRAEKCPRKSFPLFSTIPTHHGSLWVYPPNGDQVSM